MKPENNFDKILRLAELIESGSLKPPIRGLLVVFEGANRRNLPFEIESPEDLKVHFDNRGKIPQKIVFRYHEEDKIILERGTGFEVKVGRDAEGKAIFLTEVE